MPDKLKNVSFYCLRERQKQLVISMSRCSGVCIVKTRLRAGLFPAVIMCLIMTAANFFLRDNNDNECFHRITYNFPPTQTL